MLLWFTDLMDVTKEVTIHRPNISTLLSSAFTLDEGTRQECRNVGSTNCNFSVTFIKPLNQSIIKLCLIVHLLDNQTLYRYLG